MKLSVVIPAYNEEKNIAFTLDELLATIDVFGDIKQTEIIVIDDHSADSTFNVVSAFAGKGVRCIRLSRRCGSHTALRAGTKEATGDAVLFISADGQDDPACLKNMLDKWRKGAKIVWALRKNRNDEPWHIRKTAKLFYKLLNWINGDRVDTIDLSRAGFYLLDREVVNAINSCLEKNTSLFGLITWLGFSHNFVEYERRQRKHGKSKWNFRRRLRLALDWIVAFSGLPLKIMSLIGIIVASFGFLYAIFIIIMAVKGRPATGWASMMVVILVLGGTQMIMLGIIGEYLWRNIEESRNRPLYFIEKDSSKS
jgi:dolichol-phosphate mannosyltransferase